MTSEEYKALNHYMGFIEDFPVLEIIESEEVSYICRGKFPVTFKVSLAKVGFGEGNKYSCLALVTDIVDISHKLFLSGWNSFCCYDEADTMEKALMEYAAKKGYILCHKVNSWPFAKSIISIPEKTEKKSEMIDYAKKEREEYSEYHSFTEFLK